MKCEHRKDITVSSVLNIDNDYYNKEGNKKEQSEKAFLLIYGCDKCKAIEVNFDNQNH